MPLDVQVECQLEAVFEAIERHWGELDFALHSIAFAPKEDLQGRVVDCSREGFLLAMDVSCHSFIRMAHLAEPLMKDGGALFTMSYFGAERVVENYNLMGPVKAALEASARYLAAELGPKGIRVHAISPVHAPPGAAERGKKRIWALCRWHFQPGGGPEYCRACRDDGLPCAHGAPGADGEGCPYREARPLTLPSIISTRIRRFRLCMPRYRRCETRTLSGW